MLTGRSRLNCATGFLTLLLMSSLNAADATAETREELPDHRLVFRVSDAFLNSAMDDKKIDHQAEVRETILGTSVYGEARVIGKPGIKFVESVDDATFQITLDGTIHSQTIGYNGPAIIRSRTVTTFTASRQVVFKAGSGFYALPSKVSAQTESVVEGISSSWGGLIGRIISRRARKVEAAQHALATEIVRQRIERRIAASFDRSSEQRLARLNKVADFQFLATAAVRYTGDEPKYACCTTPHYLQIATRFGDSGPAIELPASDAARGAPFEIWVHESLLVNPVTAGIEFLAPSSDSSELVTSLSTVVQRLGYLRDVPEAVRSILGNQLQTHRVKDWQVVQVDVPNVGGDGAKLNAMSEVGPNRSHATHRRIWKSGSFTADAEFLSLEGNIVRLRRNTGVKTSIPIEQLSVADRVWIQNHLAGG